MPTIQTNDINLYYEINGEGQPLVLISGLGYGLWQWHKVIPGLAEHFKVIAFDNRGAGQTDKPAGPYTVQMLAADTAGLIKALGIAPVVVLGHSMGGFVAQELALSYPELIDALVLASTHFGGPNHIPVTPEAMAVLTDTESDPVTRVKNGVAVACAPGFANKHPEVVDELVQYRLSVPVPPDAYQAQMAVGLGLLELENSFEPRLNAVKAPTIILFGEHDAVVPPGNAELLAAKILDHIIHIMPGVGHIFPIEAPDLTVKTLIELLA